jgi:hypothetical protein
MNFIQTLHIHSNKDPFHDTFGWVAPEYHLMSWALSSLQLQKLYGKIILYANSQSADLLIDTLQLPYSEIHLTHDNLQLIHPDLWALPKLYTYSLQEQPFLHIDGDVFLFNQFKSNLLNSELIAQNIEIATEYYTSMQRELMQYFTFFPNCVKKDFESGVLIQAVNAGILGGKNVSFIREYANSAFEYINKNAENLKNINVNCFNVFFEQHLFYALAHEKNIFINVLLEDIVNDNGYNHLGDFHDVPFDRSYLHLLGHFKKDEFTCIQMANKLRELYPDYYERIVALFHNKNIRLSPCGFKNQPETPINESNNSHLQLLKWIENNCHPEIDKELFLNDFEIFYLQLLSILTKNNSLPYLEKRDIAAQYWYRDLFANPSEILNQRIARCQEVEIIPSSFNWGGLFNKYYRVGAGYYQTLQIEQGKYSNLIIPEISDNGFSLYDIDELDYAILQFSSKPLFIHELLVKMQMYFEDDVIQNHYEAYKNLIMTSLQHLVVKKAIRPESD